MTKKRAAAIVVDFDNSFGEAVEAIEVLLQSPDTTRSLTNHLLETAHTRIENYQRVDVCIGTRRQFTPTDIGGMLYNAQIIGNELVLNGSAFHAHNTLYHALKHQYPALIERQPLTVRDLNHTSDDGQCFIDTHKDDFMADMDALTAHIAQHPMMLNNEKTTFFDWLKHHSKSTRFINDHAYRLELIATECQDMIGNDDTPHDDNKFILLFIQAHAIANRYPDHSIDLIFIDDHAEYAEYFHAIIQQIPHLLPHNVTFKPIQYIHSRPDETRALTEFEIKGCGKRDPDFLTTARRWDESTKKDDFDDFDAFNPRKIQKLNAHFKHLSRPDPQKEDDFDDFNAFNPPKTQKLNAHFKHDPQIAKIGAGLFREAYKNPNENPRPDYKYRQR